MIGPSLLIRWGALGTLVLLVRAIVREAQDERRPMALLTASPSKQRRSRMAAQDRDEEGAGWDDVEEAVEEMRPETDPTLRQE
jgi:hypothetical protein